MKYLVILCAFIVVIYSCPGCKKKGTAPTPVTPPKIDSPKVVDSTPATIYPYTDTFVGVLSVTYIQYFANGDQYPPEYSTDTAYRIYLNHISHDTLVFSAPHISTDLDNGSNISIDTEVIVPFGDIVFTTKGYTFETIRGVLHVNWDNFFVNYMGFNKDAESKGTYTGYVRK